MSNPSSWGRMLQPLQAKKMLKTQPKIIELRRGFNDNQCWETAQPLVAEIIKLRHDFDAAMDLHDYVGAVSLAIPLAIATNEDIDSSRLETALDSLRLHDFDSFMDATKGDAWALTKEFLATKPLAVALKLLNEVNDYHENHSTRKYACINENDLMGLLKVFRVDSYCTPLLPLWDLERDAKLLIRENKRLKYRTDTTPLGLGWWICFSRMFRYLPNSSVVDCPPPLTELFKANFPSLIFSQNYSDRDFTHEADPLVLPSIFGGFPKDKYFTCPELNPKKGKIGYALGDRKKINGRDVINNLPVDFDEIVDLEDEDLIKKGFLATTNEIASCSFVIGADCPVTHLAGALGVPSAIVLTKHHDARFGMAASGDRETLYKSQRVIMPSPLLLGGSTNRR